VIDPLSVQAVESDKRFLFDERNDLSQKLQKVKDSAAKHKSELERQIRRFKAENTEVKGWVQDKQEELDTQERGFRRQREEYSGRNKMLEKENSELREEVESKERTLDEVQGKLEGKDAEVEELQMELLRVKAQTGDVDTLKVLKKELSEQVNHIKTLESTNRRQLAELKALREGHKSIDVLQEEKRALEGKVKAMDELREQLSSVQLRASILQDERNAWESYFQSEELEFDSPESLAKALIEERVEKAVLVEKAGRSNPELQQKEEQIQDMEGQIGVLKKELESLKEYATKDGKARQRMERQRSLALKEAQFLREQLKSFQTEETVFMEKGAYDEQKTQSIQELEALLEEYKAEIEKLKAEAASFRKENELPVSRKRAFEENNDERLGELTRRNRQLQEGSYTSLMK
jgi:mitotic spindle assembly checkpoint protein MAD1